MEVKLRTPKLLPTPKKAVWGDGFLEWSKAEFHIDENGMPCGNFLQIEYVDAPDNPESYKLKISPGGISLAVCDERGARCALQTLRQIGMQADERGFRYCDISDSPDLRVRAFILDASSGRVPSIEELKLLADRLSLFKYNRFELCLTNAYAFKGKEIEWAGEGAFSPKKIESLKKYCAALGMELSCCFDLSKKSADTRALSELAANFSCADFNINCLKASKQDVFKYCRECLEAGGTPLYFADAFASKSFDAAKLPEIGIPIFRASDAETFDSLCEKTSGAGREFFVSADVKAGLCPRLEQAKAAIDSAVSGAKKYGARGMVLTSNFDGRTLAPSFALYPPIAHAAAQMWSSEVPEEAVCEALDAFVFYDATGDFARSVCALGRVDSTGFVEAMFAASNTNAKKLSAEFSNLDIDVMDGAADFAMGLAATSKPESRDAPIFLAEFALAGSMIKWALERARNDIEIDSLEQKIALKFIVSEFENVWLARCEHGGMWRASSKIRALKPEIFRQ